MQAGLEAERIALQERLEEALQLPALPPPVLTTTSPLDRVITLLDSLLQVCGLYVVSLGEWQFYISSRRQCE